MTNEQKIEVVRGYLRGLRIAGNRELRKPDAKSHMAGLQMSMMADALQQTGDEDIVDLATVGMDVRDHERRGKAVG